jgi:hypothetical protein
MILIMAFAAPAAAQPRGEPHDSFYLRGGFGAGLSLISGEGVGGVDYSSTGFSLPFEAVVGYALVPNLILGGTLVLMPQVAGDGSVDGGADLSGVTAFAWYTGPSITYYFMPVNVFIGGSFGFGQGAAEGDIELPLGLSGQFDVESDIGFGFNFAVGKQWHLAERFGFGVSGIFQFLTLPSDTGDGDNANVFLFGVLASASFN